MEVVLQLHKHRDRVAVFHRWSKLDLTCSRDGSFSKSKRQRPPARIWTTSPELEKTTRNITVPSVPFRRASSVYCGSGLNKDALFARLASC